MVSCAWSETVDEGSFGDAYSSHGYDGPYALFVNEDDVVIASVDHDWRTYLESIESEPPFSTRGITLCNFSADRRRVAISIESDSADEDDAGSTVFSRTFDLDSETGETILGVVADPGEYVVAASAGSDRSTRHEWRVSGEPREPASIGGAPRSISRSASARSGRIDRKPRDTRVASDAVGGSAYAVDTGAFGASYRRCSNGTIRF